MGPLSSSFAESVAKFSFKRIFLPIWVLFLGWCPLVAETTLYERSTRGDLFDVFGYDFQAVQYVTHMAQEMETLGGRYFQNPSELARNITVLIQAANQSSFQSAYLVDLLPGGGIKLTLRWDEYTRFEDVCEGLALAYLSRVAVWQHGASAAHDVPAWLSLGWGYLLQSRLRPAMMDPFIQDALKGRLMMPRDLFSDNPDRHSRQSLGLYGFWFFRFLESEIQNRQLFRQALSAFVGGLNPNAILVRVLPDSFESEADIDLWWAVGFQSHVRGRQTPFYTMEQSRNLVRRYAILTYEQKDGTDIRLTPGNWWSQRENNRFQIAVTDRLREIKLEMQKVNPVYYNSLLSLGLILTAVAEGDQELYESMVARFTEDLRDAQILELSIGQLTRE